MIVIIDYGLGNLNSILKALDSLNVEAKISDSIEDIDSCSGLILPGVGAFKDAMCRIYEKKLGECITRNINAGKPTLGICLGMQLLYDKGFEDGETEGLGVLPGTVIKFEGDYKIPHMGWNNLILEKDDSIIKYTNNMDYVYFVHSYYVKSKGDEVVAWTEYMYKVPAIVRKGNIIGMQFHPEKSGKTGLALLKAFKELIQ